MSSIPAGSTIIDQFLCGFICVSLCQSIKIKPTNMYIASARAHFKINTHGCWNWHLCILDGLSVVQCSLGHVIGIVFLWHNFSGTRRTYWTTGSWRSFLSLEVVSSIPAGSTIIYRFLCGFICFSLCQSIKIKPQNMYVWRLWCQKQVYQAGISNCTLQYYVVCNYLSLPEIPHMIDLIRHLCRDQKKLYRVCPLAFVSGQLYHTLAYSF